MKEYGKFLVKRMITIIVTYNVIAFCFFTGLFIFGAFIVALAGEDTGPVSSYSHLYGDGSNELLSIRVDGVITGMDSTQGTVFEALSSQTAGYEVKDKLYAAADDELIKGVILEVNSPGGTIFGSRAIAEGVEYYKSKTKKPVYTHVSGMGDSGAYWAAASTDKIYADYGSDVGSIGVIMGPIAYYNTPLSESGGLLGGGVVTQNGIETVTITAGTSKDVGNPYRKLTPAEVAALQKQVNNEYDNFVQYVSKRRNIPEATIRGQIGAMSYDTKSAQELKLIDGIMGRQAAYDKLAEAAKVKDDFVVIQEEPALGFVATLLTAMHLKQPATAEKVDLCTLSRMSLAYHGDVTGWCNK